MRGVAVVVIPGDIALREAPARAVASKQSLLPSAPQVAPAQADIEALARLIAGSAKVTLFCGRGCAGAHEPLMALAGALQAPIVHALGGKEYVEYDNPFDVGMTGFIGYASGYEAMQDCDLLLMLGTDFPYKQFLPSDCKIAQVDIRPENLGRRARLDIGVVGDVGRTLEALLPRIAPRTDRKHLDTSLKHYAASRKGLDDLAVGTPGRGPIHPQYLTKVVSDLAAEDAAFTFDVGTPTIWAARYLRMNGKRRLIGSLVHGSMANAMPQAIGIQAAQPDRQVVALAGDGGFTMLMGDLITLVQEKLPVKIIILNNGVLGFVAMEMKAGGFLETGVSLDNPDFAAMASAMRIHAIRVEDPGELPAAVADILAHDGPALLDVVAATQELSMPPTITTKEMKGFGLWMIRAVMSGRGDEVLDLAKTNLLPR